MLPFFFFCYRVWLLLREYSVAGLHLTLYCHLVVNYNTTESSLLTQLAQFLQSDCGSADDDTTVSRLAKLTTWLLSLALNGGGRIFSPRPLPYFPCLLSCLVTSHLLRDSLCIALQTREEHCSVTLLRSSPILPPHPRSLASVALNRQPDKRVCD